MQHSSSIKIILSILLTAVLCACELRPTHADAKKAFAELITVQRALQEELADLAMEAAPQYEDIIVQDTALTLMVWRSRQLQFEYLLDNDPDRLRLRRGREGLIVFNWLPADSSLLTETNPAYAKVDGEIAALEPQLLAAKLNAPAVHVFFDSLNSTPEVKSLRRVYGRDEQAIVLRYRLSAILKEAP